MTEEYEEYARYFHTDLRVEVGIPISREEVFRDWGLVREFKDDLIVVELSRDELPRRVRVGLGSILDVGVWRGQEVYICRAIVTDMASIKSLRMRLLGSVTLKDRRQFYRLNVSLRLRYSLPERGVTTGQLVAEWGERCRQEMESMRIRTGGYDDVIRDMLIRPKEPGKNSLVWHDRPDIRGVIGGGGIGFRVHRKLPEGALLSLELHLPLYPFRIIHAIGEVVYVLDPVREPGSSEPVFHTGMRFFRIEERDRDHVIEFISQAELERLRELSGRRHVRESDRVRLEQAVKLAQGREKMLNALFLVLVFILVFLLTSYLLAYKKKHGENEIGKEFHRSLTK